MRLQSYYEHLPPKRMNVRIERRNIPDGDGSLTLRDVLVATKDFKAGDEIYTEHPVVAVLDSDIQEQGSHCSYCLREMHNGVAIKMNGDLTNSVYCSKKCQIQAKAQYQNFLFGIENPVHVESILTDEADRRVAQKAFADYLKNSHQIVGLLVARLVALHVTCETSKFSPPNDPIRSHIPELAMSSQYGLYDHLERMRYVSTSDPEEWKLFNNLLAKTLPGIEASHPNEYHTAFRSKAAYNMIGVCCGGGRDDRPSFADRPELIERSRTPYGTSKQIGAGLYIVSSYLLHSCAPSVRPSFSSGTSELHLIATRDISQDELLSMAYVNVTRGVEESPEECRRRRRYELARGWKFACRCNRCMENSEPEEIPGISGDHSTVEAVYDMLSRNEASNANDVE